MSDYFNGVLVVFNTPLHEDSAKATVECIRQLRNVMSVETVTADPMVEIAHARARNDIVAAIYGMLQEKKWKP